MLQAGLCIRIDGIYMQSGTVTYLKGLHLPDKLGGRYRGFLKRHDKTFCKETIQTLKGRAEKCDLRVVDVQAWVEEHTKIERQTEDTEKSNPAGIYVYTYPHYLGNLVVPGNKRFCCSDVPENWSV